MEESQNAKCLYAWSINGMKTDRFQYLGPNAGQLVHLFILAMTNSFTLFMLSAMLIRTIWGLGGNVTTIESWEIARHRKLLRRARAFGGYLDGPDGVKVKIERHEFPYDIGIWANIKQGMDSGNIPGWLWPFVSTPSSSGLEFEVNGFDEPFHSWPPPDPDRIPRLQRSFDGGQAFIYQQTPLSDYEEIEAFKKRQQDDLERRESNTGVVRRKPFHDRHGSQFHGKQSDAASDEDSSEAQSDSGEEGWRSPEGDRLRDYGVDEDAEFYDQDDIPLSELLRRRRGEQSQHS
jgi:palmitoyltransferase